MRRDSNLEDVDIIKLLLYALILVACSITMVFGFIVPSIKEYKEAKIVNNDKFINLNKITQVYNNEFSAFTNLKNENELPLRAMENSFDEGKFIKESQSYFGNVSLKPISSEGGEFIKYELMLSGSMDSPAKFYNFIEFINSYDNVIKIGFPITMSAKDEAIDISFMIEVYKHQLDQ